jgi:hypothetical protein
MPDIPWSTSQPTPASSGSTVRKAHRQPMVLASSAPYDGPSRPGRIQAAASRANTRGRWDSG